MTAATTKKKYEQINDITVTLILRDVGRYIVFGIYILLDAWLKYDCVCVCHRHWRRRQRWRIKQMLTAVSEHSILATRIQQNRRNEWKAGSAKRQTGGCRIRWLCISMSGFVFTVCLYLRVCVCIYVCFTVDWYSTLYSLASISWDRKSTSKITLDASYFFSMSDRDYFLFILLLYVNIYICALVALIVLLDVRYYRAHFVWQIYLF